MTETDDDVGGNEGGSSKQLSDPVSSEMPGGERMGEQRRGEARPMPPGSVARRRRLSQLDVWSDSIRLVNFSSCDRLLVSAKLFRSAALLVAVELKLFLGTLGRVGGGKRRVASNSLRLLNKGLADRLELLIVSLLIPFVWFIEDIQLALLLATIVPDAENVAVSR